MESTLSLKLKAMKRLGNLIESVAAIENLELAFCKARRGKNHQQEVEDFSRDIRNNLNRLRLNILTGNPVSAGYRFFYVYDPKKRAICAAPFHQRVMQHAMMNICHNTFDSRQTSDSYASRKGMGTYAALARAAGNQKKYDWYLKLDVRKYFDSISHEIVRKQLSSMFKDARLLKIFSDIIDTHEVSPGRGMPIGNLTSQYFANHYLSVADHFVREQLKIPAYIRYMDDMVLWHNDRNRLLEAGNRFRDFIQEKLDLTLKPFCMNRREAGLPFLGYQLFPDRIWLGMRSRRRYIRKLTQFEENLNEGTWTEKQYQRHITPLTAFTMHADAAGFRRVAHLRISDNMAGYSNIL